MSITVEVTSYIELTDEDITDLMITALEGGIGYWAVLDNTGEEYANAPEGEAVSETCARLLLKGEKVWFEDIEDGERWFLDMGKLKQGIELFLKHDYDIYRAFGYRRGRIDMANIDAERADIIIQLSLFGYVMFG